MSLDPYGLLPLRPVAYQVLLALADGERHGYGIVQDISQRTAARMSLEPGNLYRTLKWMLEHLLIEESDRRPAPDLDDERRRYYRITGSDGASASRKPRVSKRSWQKRRRSDGPRGEVPQNPYNGPMRAPFIALPLLALLLPAADRTVFFDDFNGRELDRARWNVIVTGRTVNNEQQAYVDSPDVLTVKDGSLVIRPRFRQGFKTPEGRSFDFISGRIDTRSKVSFTYGNAAARIKLAAGDGLWPAFWALGDGRWPDTGEIDIMENVGDASWTSVALHGPGYFGDTPLVKRSPLVARHDATDWHVYAVDWTRDELVFTVDKRVIYRVTRAMVERHGRWAFDNPKHLILNLALGGDYPAKVNGAGAAQYRGLPDATVRSIQKDEPKILVDWVRVTSR